jgi:TPR repeat protein
MKKISKSEMNERFNCFYKSAIQGNIEAQQQLAFCYRFGKGTKKGKKNNE